MKILFDQGVPVPLRRFLHPHDVDTAAERGENYVSVNILKEEVPDVFDI